MKTGLVLTAILLIAITVNSVGISAPDNVPAGTQWTISTDYYLPVNSEVDIYLNDDLILSVFEHAGKAFVDDTQKSDLVLYYNANLTKATLSIAQMPVGNANIRVSVYKNGDALDSYERDISFFDSFDRISSLEDTTKDQSKTIAVQEVTIKSQAGIISSQAAMIEVMKKDLNSKADEISALKRQNQDTISSISMINSNITQLQVSDLDKNASLERINTDLNKLIKDKEFETGLTGLISFGTAPSTLFAMVSLAALLSIGMILYRSRKKDKLY
jgi:hypothetical protein